MFNGAPRSSNISRFCNVRDYIPEWAERGWTLQELVLSRTTFVNSAWEPLGRPVEGLGPYYYVLPLYRPLLWPQQDAGRLKAFWDPNPLASC